MYGGVRSVPWVQPVSGSGGDSGAAEGWVGATAGGSLGAAPATMATRIPGAPGWSPSRVDGSPHQKRKTNEATSRSWVGAVHTNVQGEVASPVSTAEVVPRCSSVIHATTGSWWSAQLPSNVTLPPRPTCAVDAATRDGTSVGRRAVVDVVVDVVVEAGVVEVVGVVVVVVVVVVVAVVAIVVVVDEGSAELPPAGAVPPRRNNAQVVRVAVSATTPAPLHLLVMPES